MNELVELLESWKLSPLKCIEDIWGLVPQKLNDGVPDDLDADLYTEEDFEPFQAGKHITWQQWLIFRAVEYAINGKAPARISVASGHGIGKSSSLALLMYWFLLSHPECIIPCTAPTASQLHDVLWKELSYWKSKMPPEIAGLFYLTSDYLRVSESPKTWFARARTASKENPEALAGLHADDMLFVIDEASAVPDEVFEVAEGALTSSNTLVVMISNYTRVRGYFHNSRTTDKDSWQVLRFSSNGSPIVSYKYIERLETLYGKDSDEYRVRIEGLPPTLELGDGDGWVNLLEDKDLNYIDGEDFIGPIRLGVDPAGDGKDETVWVLRDNFKAAVVGYEEKSTEESIAQKTNDIMAVYNISAKNVIVDNFGVGAGSVQKLALMGHNVLGINVGDKVFATGFLNMRAYAFWGMRYWLKAGKCLIKNKRWKQLLDIKFKRKETGTIQIMSKEKMRKSKIDSPNAADAFMLTFVDGNEIDDIPRNAFGDLALQDREEVLYPDLNI
jgi:hypothetical protein